MRGIGDEVSPDLIRPIFGGDIPDDDAGDGVALDGGGIHEPDVVAFLRGAERGF